MRKKLASKALVTSVLALSLAGCYKGVSHLEDIRQMHAQTDLSLLYSWDLPKQRLTLDEVVEIALQRNLELQVKATQWEIQHEVATGEKLKMLPNLIANGEVSYRNKNTGTSSKSLVPNIPPAPPSISSEQNVHRYDITAVWNLLDFGLSYYRSRQETNRALIQKMEYERQQQNLITDVTRQYWRAIAAKKAIDGAREVVAKAKRQRVNLDSQIKDKLIPPIVGLRNKNEILNIEIGLQVYEKEYHTAMSALSALMGLPSCISFELVECEVLPYQLPHLDICCLEEVALTNRPELFSTDIEEVIGADEVRIAILEMFPGPELFAGFFYDGNKYLIHNHWLLAGARASWNLLAIPRHWSHLKLGEYRKELAKANRLALSVGVMAQLHLAYDVYLDTLEQYNLSKELLETNLELLKAASAEFRSGKINPADILRYEFEYLLAEISAWKAFGELQNSIEAINNALGIPFYFKAECRAVEGCNVPFAQNSRDFRTEYNPEEHHDNHAGNFEGNQLDWDQSAHIMEPTGHVINQGQDINQARYIDGHSNDYLGNFNIRDYEEYPNYDSQDHFRNRGIDSDSRFIQQQQNYNRMRQQFRNIRSSNDHPHSNNPLYSHDLSEEEQKAISQHNSLNEKRLYQDDMLADWHDEGGHKEENNYVAWEPTPEPIHPKIKIAERQDEFEADINTTIVEDKTLYDELEKTLGND